MCQPLVKECRAVNLKCCVAGGDFMSNRHLYNRVSFLVSSSSNNRSQLRTVKYRNDIGRSHLLFNPNSDPISYPTSAFIEMKTKKFLLDRELDIIRSSSKILLENLISDEFLKNSVTGKWKTDKNPIGK